MSFGSFMATTVLKRLSKFFDRRSSPPDNDSNLVIHGDEHSLSDKQLCKYALEVVRVLQRNNYQAYAVGGCVRDLLLGLNPKDFDVATNAKPHEVKRLFKRSRIVGRRFQIVHVQFGREIIEVTTFRSNTSSKNAHLQQAANGLLTRDNMFGSMEEDASRRDLSINALYYDPINNTLHDFSGGLEDLKDRTIRIIGDPATRYKEDPVRLLRVARFAAKLGFHVEPKTLKPIAKMAGGLSHVSAPRMFDETLKLFMGGQGLAVFNLLTEYNLLQQLLPQTHRLIEQGHPYANRILAQAMTNTDLRIRNNKRVTPAFIYAALLWPPVQKYSLEYQQQGHSASVALNKAANDVIGKQIAITAIPKRFTTAMREIWSLQLMLPRRAGNRAKRLSEHPRFRAAYDFILLREQSGEELNGLGDWWTTYQEVSEDQQQKMVALLTKGYPKKRRSRRRPRGKTDA
jgi:poly(A) polymerase